MLKAGLLGHPIRHSLSPAIHNAAYRALGLDWVYELYPGEDEAAFLAIVQEARQNPRDYIGFNVTTPYKYEAFALCDEHSFFAAAAGNSNVLSFLNTNGEADILRGDNTDGRGLLAALKREMDVDAAGASVVLCGTGPVAMSTLLALINDAAASVIVVSRDKEKGSAQVGELCARLDAAISLPALEILDYSEVAAYLETADILINATTLGMNPSDPPVVPADALRSELIVFDVIYGHGHTALRKAADTVGARFTDGIGMLVEQAALTLEIWMSAQGITREVPRELMYKVAEDELAKQELPK